MVGNKGLVEEVVEIGGWGKIRYAIVMFMKRIIKQILIFLNTD